MQDELRSLQYSDGSLLKVEPEEPQTLSATPFTFVDTVTGLKSLAAKLSTVQEIAVIIFAAVPSTLLSTGEGTLIKMTY